MNSAAPVFATYLIYHQHLTNEIIMGTPLEIGDTSFFSVARIIRPRIPTIPPLRYSKNRPIIGILLKLSPVVIL